jgi:hypothetical protein
MLSRWNSEFANEVTSRRRSRDVMRRRFVTVTDVSGVPIRPRPARMYVIPTFSERESLIFIWPWILANNSWNVFSLEETIRPFYAQKSVTSVLLLCPSLFDVQKNCLKPEIYLNSFCLTYDTLCFEKQWLIRVVLWCTFGVGSNSVKRFACILRFFRGGVCSIILRIVVHTSRTLSNHQNSNVNIVRSLNAVRLITTHYSKQWNARLHRASKMQEALSFLYTTNNVTVLTNDNEG